MRSVLTHIFDEGSSTPLEILEMHIGRALAHFTFEPSGPMSALPPKATACCAVATRPQERVLQNCRVCRIRNGRWIACSVCCSSHQKFGYRRWAAHRSIACKIGPPPHLPARGNALTNGTDFLKCKRRVLVASWLPMLNLQGPLLMKPAANLLR